MPFPLAHPAAVLPLKRFCPRWLSFPALVVGSLSPDAAYVFAKLKVEQVSHRPMGIVYFCIPAGLLFLVLMYASRSWFINRLPARYRGAFLPDRWRPFGSVVVVLFSLLIGAATHLLWDSITHKGAWVVSQLPVLDMAVASFGGHAVRVCRILWYASSFAGVAILCVAYRKSQQGPARDQPGQSANVRWLEAASVALLVLPVELLHDLIRNRVGALLVAVLSVALVGAVVWRSTCDRETSKVG